MNYSDVLLEQFRKSVQERDSYAAWAWALELRRYTTPVESAPPFAGNHERQLYEAFAAFNSDKMKGKELEARLNALFEQPPSPAKAEPERWHVAPIESADVPIVVRDENRFTVCELTTHKESAHARRADAALIAAAPELLELVRDIYVFIVDGKAPTLAQLQSWGDDARPVVEQLKRFT
jgi:hypothetical protein